MRKTMMMAPFAFAFVAPDGSFESASRSPRLLPPCHMF